jgi:hypothetical protein
MGLGVPAPFSDCRRLLHSCSLTFSLLSKLFLRATPRFQIPVSPGTYERYWGDLRVTREVPERNGCMHPIAVNLPRTWRGSTPIWMEDNVFWFCWFFCPTTCWQLSCVKFHILLVLSGTRRAREERHLLQSWCVLVEANTQMLAEHGLVLLEALT